MVDRLILPKLHLVSNSISKTKVHFKGRCDLEDSFVELGATIRNFIIHWLYASILIVIKLNMVTQSTYYLIESFTAICLIGRHWSHIDCKFYNHHKIWFSSHHLFVLPEESPSFVIYIVNESLWSVKEGQKVKWEDVVHWLVKDEPSPSQGTLSFAAQ